MKCAQAAYQKARVARELRGNGGCADKPDGRRFEVTMFLDHEHS